MQCGHSLFGCFYLPAFFHLPDGNSREQFEEQHEKQDEDGR
jgi:hypothetical protein